MGPQRTANIEFGHSIKRFSGRSTTAQQKYLQVVKIICCADRALHEKAIKILWQ